MFPFFPVAQISPGVGTLEGIFLLFSFIALIAAFFLSGVGCGMRAWQTARRGSKASRRWFAASVISMALFFGSIGGCFWMFAPKPLPHFEKHWDFTQSHGIEIIGEHGDQTAFSYTGDITVQILLPDQRSLSVHAQNLVVKCEQGQVKEIEILIPKLKSLETVRQQGETILQRLNSAPALIEQWKTSYPGFGWTTIKGSTTVEPKIDLEADYDEHTTDTVMIIWIEWKHE